MENGCGEDGVGPGIDGWWEVVGAAGAPRGDDGDGDRVPDFCDEFQVEAGFGAVAVHGVQQDFARP